jgi:glucosamine--fructose-6-phosphate aminotransferase (isomerizing)
LWALGGEAVKFSQVVMEVMRQIEGAYALIFKSSHYPNELVACKCGSPLLLGVKECGDENKRGAFVSSELTLAKDGKPKEFFLASDASAMVEHTKKVMVIEDNEVVHVRVRISCYSRILLKLMTSLLL